MTPYFSIIIPLYNKEKHIKTTLKSVTNQTFPHFEVIIVNDGSTDASLEQAKSIEDERIIIHNIQNKGVSHARNYGISQSKSDKIVLLDADDVWENFHLEDLKYLYEQFPNCGMYATAYSKEKNNYRLKSIYNKIPNQKHWHGIVENYFESSFANSIAWTSAVMIPKTTFNSVGYFNESYNSGEDTDLWIRIALKYPVAFYNKVSAYHLLDSENKLTNKRLKNRKHIDFSKYDALAKTNADLKKYIDLNRASMAVQYKIEGEKTLSNQVKHQIDFNNLTTLQKILLRTPKPICYIIIKLRNALHKVNIDLRLFK